MDCQVVQSMLSTFHDGRVLESERRPIADHLSTCPGCSAELKTLVAIRGALLSTPREQMPTELPYQLRSLASREAARRRIRVNIGVWVRELFAHASVNFSNLLRPLAIPAAAGIVSTVFLFSMVLTNFMGIVRQPVNDVPIAIATDPTFKAFSVLDFADTDVTVDIFVDEQGRVIDYAFPPSERAAKSSQFRRMLENYLLFTEFNPATTFGRPTYGWIRVTLRRSEMEVKG